MRERCIIGCVLLVWGCGESQTQWIVCDADAVADTAVGPPDTATRPGDAGSATRDTGPAARDAMVGDCWVPPQGHCCCTGDLLRELSCVAGRWTCEAGSLYYLGDDCLPACGGPCALPCPVWCTGAAPMFPSLDRGCATDADCDLVIHQTDCCGSVLHTGIARHQRSLFDLYEAQCRSQYLGCLCTGTQVADDGTVPGSVCAPHVSCVSGTCTASFSPTP